MDLNPNDGLQYLWDDDNYRFHNGSWAAWPANGGTNALNPSVNAYPPNMDSMMKYGPIDLSDAAVAETTFWLWRYMQANYDYLKFGVSSDGTNFQGFIYTGIANSWQQITVPMNNYVGDSSVWVAWEFVSNASVQYEGPWVDDITISKEAPGYVNVYGTLTYKGRDNLSKPAANTLVKLMEDDPSGIDDVLGGTFTNDAGYYSFPPVLNWDSDGDADTSNRNLDLYVVFESSNADYKVTEVFANINHRWETPLSSNVSSTGLLKNLYIYSPTDRLGAMWLFHDLKRARDFVINQAGINPGFATTTWQYQNNCDIYNTCNGPAYFSPGIGIFVPENSLVSVDTIVHEIGHHFLYNLSGPVNGSCPSQHYITQISNINCAWKEGWAEFFPIVVNLSLSSSDVCYDFASGNCSNQSVNLETVNPAATGDTVEGRVAAALLDLYDINNEGYDSASFGFSPIAQVSMQEASEHSLWDFWNSWKASGYDRHNAVRAIYQNAINYNNTPTLISLPDWSVPHDSSWSNVFNLLGYASDVETSTSLLAWQITSISDSRCGVSIDAQKNIDIVPQAN